MHATFCKLFTDTPEKTCNTYTLIAQVQNVRSRAWQFFTDDYLVALLIEIMHGRRGRPEKR